MPKLAGKVSGDEEPRTVEVGDGHNGAVTIRRTRGKAQAAGDSEAAATDEQATRKAARVQMSLPELLTDATKRVRGASLKLSAKTVSQETVLSCASDLFKAARQLWAVGKAGA